jgi:hypothetical protein
MHVPARSAWPAAAVLIATLLAAGAGTAAAQDYPRLGLYGQVLGDGYPLWDRSGAFNDTAFAAVARYDEVILDASPVREDHPDAIARLRAMHPGIRLLAYVTACQIYPYNRVDSLTYFPCRYWRTVRDLDGFLYDKQGGFFGDIDFASGNVNIAKRDAQGRYVVARALSDLFDACVFQTGLWDGIFVDLMSSSILWAESPAESIDIVRAGYTTRAAFDAAWRAGMDTLATRLRQHAGGAAVLVGNGAQGVGLATFNGWMRENFPNLGGGTWTSNMFRDPDGYLVNETRFVAPRHDYISSSSSDPSQPASLDNARRARLGLASAAYGAGYGVIGPPFRSVRVPFHAWWYDEYAVDLTTGRNSALAQHTGWLGQPRGPAYQMVWPGPGADAVTNAGFESDVTSGWSFFTAQGATVTQDLTRPAVGAASARMHVPLAAPDQPWATSLSTTSRVALAGGGDCSATLWVRASVACTLLVSADPVGGGGPMANCAVDTAWRHVQLVMRPAASGQYRLMLFPGGVTGDIWVDDVHLQSGTSNVFRRDFDNGIVLVNPAAVSQTVVLEQPFRRILGDVDPSANDGVLSGTVTVPPLDARFLIGTDAIAPAPVNDLRPTPPRGP